MKTQTEYQETAHAEELRRMQRDKDWDDPREEREPILEGGAGRNPEYVEEE